jgi:uncharacterized protein (TIGR02444 family)
VSQAALDLDHPFWRFSLAVYGDSAVQAECLDVQERYEADVNLLLFCAYLGAEGLTLGTGDLDEVSAAVRPWHQDVVRSLRSARRALKPWSANGVSLADRAAPLRRDVQAIEIRAEQIEQAMLWHWLRSHRERLVGADQAQATDANLRAFLTLCGAPSPDVEPQVALPNLIRASAHQRS